MQPFSLQTYLLNESLNSTILSLKILNEPSGFFRQFYNNQSIGYTAYKTGVRRLVYTDVIDMCGKCNKCISHLFSGNFLSYHILSLADVIDMFDPEIQGKLIKTTTTTGKYYELPDDMLLKINKKYNKLIKDIQRKCKNCFKRPDGQIIPALSNASQKLSGHNIKDIQNLTDSNFKTYTLRDLKKIGNVPDGDLLFWFRKSDNNLLCISDSDKILIDNMFAGVQFYEHYRINEEHTLALENYLIKLTIKTTLQSGDVIEWPLLDYFGSVASKISDYTTVSEIIRDREIKSHLLSSYSRSVKKTGNPTSSVSNIRKGIGWGKDAEDYVIILTYPKSLSNANIFFNTDRVALYKKDTVETAYNGSSTQQQYKWQDDDLLILQPYRVNLLSDKFVQNIVIQNEETGKLEVKNVTLNDPKIYQENKVYFCTNADKYNAICKENNLNRYKSLSSLVKYKKEVLEILRNIKEEQAIISEIMAEVNRLIKRYKEIRRDLNQDEIKFINTALMSPDDNTETVATKVNKLITAHTDIEISYDTLLKDLKALEGNIVQNKMDNDSTINSINSKIETIKSKYMTTESIDLLNRQIEYVKELLSME